MKLSVIIPTYNRANLLRQAVDSICKVSHRPLEVVVVDDGSTDDTPARESDIRSLCGLHSVDCQWMRQTNSGASMARNAGLALATGEFVQWVDADDTVIARGVDELVERLVEDICLGVAYGLVEVVDSAGTVLGTMGKAPTYRDSDLFDLLWHTMGAVFRKESLGAKLRWNPKIVLGDDWDFSSRVRIAGVSYKFTRTTVGTYLKHDFGSLTVKEFNERKCFNVIEAVLSIRDALIDAGKLSLYLQQRCYNRALVHAVELSAHRSALAKKAYEVCREIGSPTKPLMLLQIMLQSLPIQVFHRIVFRVLRSKK